MNIENFPALIVVTPLILSFFVTIIGIWNKKLCFPIVFAALAASFVFSLGILDKVVTSGKPIYYTFGGWTPPWGIEYAIDHLNALILVVVSFVSLLVSVYAKRSVEKELPQSKLHLFYTLFLLQITGLFGITATGDAFNLYVLLEIASFAAYAMIAMGEKGAVFASFRYVIYGTIGACAYLMGVGFLYILTGSLNMLDFARLLPAIVGSKPLIIGMAFFIVGISIKMGIFPLHSWMPDSYTLAPSAVSSLLAPLFTKVGAYVIIRLLFTVFDPDFSTEIYPLTEIMGWITVVGILFAGIMALAQTDLKRMFTYLIVAEMGYIVIGICCANQMGLTGSILHIVNDMLMMVCLFTAVGAIYYQTGSRKISDLRTVHRIMPITMTVFLVGSLSVIGVPPFCGFFSKWYLLLGAINAEKWHLLVVLLVSSLINAILFFRVIEKAYIEPREEGVHDHHCPVTVSMDKVPISMLVPMVIIAASILLMGFFSNSIVTNIIVHALPASL